MSGTLPAEQQGGEIELFDPEKTKLVQAQADAAIQYAKRVKDWPTLETAVDKKIKDQTQFVGWWNRAVTTRQSPGGAKSETKVLRADRRSILSLAKAEKQTGIKHQQVSRWKLRLEKPDEYKAMLYGAAYAKAMCEANMVTYSGDTEWYTPSKYIELARSALGDIDLDPASNPIAQETVKAAEWFGAEKDGPGGLGKDWHGRVFLNPPYAAPLVRGFTDKLIAELDAGRVTAAILLTNNNTDAVSWQSAAKRSSAVCFTAGRISFWNQAGRVLSPADGQTFAYFGPEVDAFAAVFGEVGVIMTYHSGG